jgi:hypothetical protein
VEEQELAILTSIYNDAIELYVDFLNNARGTSYGNALGIGDYIDLTDEEWVECSSPYVDHLKRVLEEDWPEEFDLTPIHAAIAAHEN